MNAPTDASPPANPGVHFPPPTFFVAGFLIAWLLETRVLRLRLAGGGTARVVLEIAGAVVAALGLALGAWGLLTFARARTAIYPNRPASRIVTHGPYRFTRNPMYVGLAFAYLGIALGLNMGWPPLLLPLVLLALGRFVIRREERYLAGAFGEEYDRYRARVRRWL